MSPPSEKTRAAFRRRQEVFSSWLAESGIFACVLDDFENLRSSQIRWLSGHPMDAILFVFADGRTTLVPWDLNLARERAAVDEIVPYTDFKRSFREAVIAVLNQGGGGSGSGRKAEFAGHTTFLRHRELIQDLPDFEIIIRSDGCDAQLGTLRARKDDQELAILEKAARITDEIADIAVRALGRTGRGVTEHEMAQLLEKEAVARGAEGMGFETLAAGPARSWGIHPFPSSTAGAFGTDGLSILDFGVKVEGYTSDVTITVARGKLAEDQERMIALVEQAYRAALAAARPGAPPREPAAKADEVFAGAGWRMPHALGHGIGLDAHERPLLHVQGSGPDTGLVPGMVFTVEPGLYHPQHGGVRWENDVLMTETGPRVLTGARIIRL
ncbi:MAG TPA: Xaa-Pro peptidase family protein [Spirochaetia bacterium]|nr:Xaa-Pro peptidase family protein [Spirochaetia bacterium]